MADEYIRKEDAVNVAQNYHCSHDITIVPNTSYSNGFRDGYKLREDEILEGLSELKPAADVRENKYGMWIYHTYMPHTKYCSSCGKNSPYDKSWKFCPNCGAKMDGGKQDGS